MKYPPIKGTPKEPENIPSLKKEIARLQEKNAKMEIKIKTQATTILTARTQKAKVDHKIAILQFKYNELKKEKQPCYTIFKGIDDEHDDKPPKNKK